MKESIIVGILAGALTVTAFALGLHLGESQAVVHVCEDGQLYAGYEVDGEMRAAQVVYPVDKAQCNNA